MTHRCAAWRHQHRYEDCQGCRAAYNARAGRRRAARYAQRVLDGDGRLVAMREGLPHGDASTYVNWGCRCTPCSAAKTADGAYAAKVVTGAKMPTGPRPDDSETLSNRRDPRPLRDLDQDSGSGA